LELFRTFLDIEALADQRWSNKVAVMPVELLKIVS